MSEATGLAALAREADLWRELAEIRGKQLASRALATRHLNAREDLVLRRLRQLGVDTRSLFAVERFTLHMLITHDEARAVRIFITKGVVETLEAHVLGALLGRIILELDGPPCGDDEPETSPS